MRINFLHISTLNSTLSGSLFNVQFELLFLHKHCYVGELFHPKSSQEWRRKKKKKNNMEKCCDNRALSSKSNEDIFNVFDPEFKKDNRNLVQLHFPCRKNRHSACSLSLNGEVSL